jgi:hypothetical protein
MNLGHCIEFLGVGSAVDDSEWRFWLVFQNLVQGNFSMGTFPAASHESRIYDNARKPREKRRPALKGAQPGVGRAQTVLQRILCIFFVA